MNNHNKKRNVGLIYEQLIRFASKCLLEGRSEKAEIAMSILKDHFKPGTELYKEFRLFNALVQSTMPSEAIALRVLEEAKKAAVTHDSVKLDKEKSALIRSINKKIDFPGFFDMRIPEYRKLATVQTLLNDWRTQDTSVNTRKVMYEAKIVEHLVQEKIVEKAHKKSEVTSLSLKLMKEKLARKYSSSLTQEQISLIGKYVKAGVGRSDAELVESCEEIKNNALNCVKTLHGEKDKVLTEKISPVLKEISSLPTKNLDESSLSKYLTLLNLIKEAQEKESN